MLKSEAESKVIDSKKDRRFKHIAKMMEGNLVGNSLADTKSFKTELQQVDGQWQVTLIPLRNDLKQMWQKLVLYIPADLKMVSKVEFYEVSGDYTSIAFKNIQVNQPVDF
jgi:outer membrane lipoprotein carrier protein